MLDDLSWSHILLLLLVTLVVVGPKDLPRLTRMVGQWMGKARSMADQFKGAFDDMARQTELDELRKEIANLKTERPLGNVERALHQSIIPDDMKPQVVVDPPLPEPGPEPREGELAVTDAPILAAGYEPPAT